MYLSNLSFHDCSPRLILFTPVFLSAPMYPSRTSSGFTSTVISGFLPGEKLFLTASSRAAVSSGSRSEECHRPDRWSPPVLLPGMMISGTLRA